MAKTVTVDTLRRMKTDGEKITALTAYDHSFAHLVDKAGVDVVLVGDSLGMVFRGEENTLNVTVEDVAYHTRAVKNGISRAFLVADMPFLSFQISEEETLQNAGTLIREGAQAVKLEGASKQVLLFTERLIETGVPVMGHVGLTPQSIHQLGGFKIQGKQLETAKKITRQAIDLQNAGAFAVVLECIPADLAGEITSILRIPTIGIGAGPDCDGQILVINDLLGLTSGFRPKFVKQYVDLGDIVEKAIKEYVSETQNGVFPNDSQTYKRSETGQKILVNRKERGE